LRSNKQLQFYGKQKAQLEIDICRMKVEDAGLRSGVRQSGNAATGAVLGVTLGGAVGASAGMVGGLPGVTIGAAAGAGIGMIIGLVGGTFKPLVPDPPYADAVAKWNVFGWLGPRQIILPSHHRTDTGPQIRRGNPDFMGRCDFRT
jgi:hypothetical protein